MNLLKQMIIDGKICMDYACLTAEYQFEATDAEPQAFRYFFPVPQGGQVTGLQLLDQDGRLLRGEVCSLKEETLKDAGLSLVRLSPSLYCLTVQQEMGICRVLLQMLLPLSRRGDRVRFVFPTGMETADLCGGKNRCRIQMDLELDEAEVSSIHHAIEKTDRGITAEFDSGTDFVLEYQEPARQSVALIQENREETVGIYRLCPGSVGSYRKSSYKRVLLLLDTTGTRDEKRFAQVRELFLRILQALPQEMVVQAVFAGAPRSMVLPSFMSVGETLTQILFQALKVCPRGGNLREMLEHLPKNAEEETMVILVSSGLSPDLYRPLNQKTKIHLFTVGTVAETPLGEFWQQTGQGTHHHCYLGENLTQRTRDGVNWLFSCCGEVEVVPQDTVVQEWYPLNRDLAADGYLDVAVRFFGAPPQTFLLRQRNMDKEIVTAERITVYSHLPMASQLFASAKIGKLTQLLSRVDTGSVRAIKEQIEKVSLCYGVLSQETMLAIQAEGVKAAVPTRLVLAPGEDLRPTLFGEREKSQPMPEEKEKDCLAVFVKYLHSDGSVCDGQTVDLNGRKTQTVWAVLGLSLLANGYWDSVRNDAEEYLNGWTPDGILGDLYKEKDHLLPYLKARHKELSELCAQVTDPQDVISAAKLVIKNNLR